MARLIRVSPADIPHNQLKCYFAPILNGTLFAFKTNIFCIVKAKNPIFSKNRISLRFLKNLVEARNPIFSKNRISLRFKNLIK
jgi:hypothetical protein